MYEERIQLAAVQNEAITRFMLSPCKFLICDQIDFEIEQNANHVVSVRTSQLSVCCQNDILEMKCDCPVAFVCNANIASGSRMHLLRIGSRIPSCVHSKYWLLNRMNHLTASL